MSVGVTASNVTTPGNCPQEFSVTRTWTATDDCGNTSTCSRTISVTDNTAPTITCPNPAAGIECPNTPNFGSATASDYATPAVLLHSLPFLPRATPRRNSLLHSPGKLPMIAVTPLHAAELFL